MTAITNYSEQVSMAMAQWQVGIRTDENLIGLAKLLGCYSVNLGIDTELSQPDQPSADDEKIVSDALRKMLSLYVSDEGGPDNIETTIIDGLSRHERWRACLDNRASAYAFAVIILRFFENGLASRAKSYAEHAHHRTVALTLNEVLLEWLKPESDVVYTRRSLASALFGEAWCVYTVDTLGRRDSIAKVVESKRPPFVPGALRFDLDLLDENLPDMDC